MRGARGATIVLAACLIHAASAAALPRVKLSTSFAPDIPGRSTTIHYAFTISEPLPLRSMELRLPAGMSLERASLGLSECTALTLMVRGPKGCPPNSLVGFGTAYAEVVAKETVRERAKLTVLMGPAKQGRPTVLFFVEGVYPAVEELVLHSQLLQVARPFEYGVKTEVPLLQSWPGGPDISLMRLQTTIGPQGLHYYYDEHGHEIEFRPRGLNVPDRCPKGGYPVQARFQWWGISRTAVARTRVRCGKRRTSLPGGHLHRSAPDHRPGAEPLRSRPRQDATMRG